MLRRYRLKRLYLIAHHLCQELILNPIENKLITSHGVVSIVELSELLLLDLVQPSLPFYFHQFLEPISNFPHILNHRHQFIPMLRVVLRVFLKL
jgi:hypothetical protein